MAVVSEGQLDLENLIKDVQEQREELRVQYFQVDKLLNILQTTKELLYPEQVSPGTGIDLE